MRNTRHFAKGNQDSPPSVEDWLRMLTRERRLSRAVHDVIQSAITNPELASYASALEFGQAAKVNIATVTRAAQALGFSGWPELRQEIRARFLVALTAPEVAVVHRAHSSGQPFDDALNRDIENLGLVRKALDRRRVQQFAKSIAAADRRLVVASGSNAIIARALVHNASLAGYSSELLDDGVVAANKIADARPGDVVIAFTFWRLYRSTSVAVRQAKSLGATICVIADTAASPLVQIADSVVVVPAEGVSFFPSLVPGLAVVEGICAELAAIDPQHSGKAIAAAERQWKEFGLLLFKSSGKGGS